MTGVYAPELTREAIFRAPLNRRTFATSGPRMSIRFAVNGQLMGGEVWKPAGNTRTVTARALTCDPIETLEIIRNGQVARSAAGDGGRDVSLQWYDQDSLAPLAPARPVGDERFAYSYLRVRTIYGDLGWSSQVGVHQA